MRCSCLILVLALAGSGAAYALEAGTGVKVTPLLKTSTSWDGKPIVYPKGAAEITGLIVEIAPGAQTGWHLHPVPSFGLILQGTLEVKLKDGRVKRLHQGEAVAEVVDTLHNGRNVGDDAVKIAVFYAGVRDEPLTAPEKTSTR